MLGQCRELLNVTLAVRPTFVDGDEVRRKRSFTDDCTGDFGGRGRIVASRIFLHIPGKTMTDSGSRMYLQDHALHSGSGLWSKRVAQVGVHTTSICCRRCCACETCSWQ
ncbi:unnamed protein product [Prorocentrum cordatum]|uniref:Uncharacterized protein n=1 Tax=Prorocentrum cordatum TaxID=2364126 RepID=A0ABN9WCW1_9DINO|nr:unnamed protein product [Polarella glacialis]